MRWILSTIFVLVLAPLSVQAATADLSITASDITFSKDTLIVGDSIRIYAQVRNVGDTDVTGYVSFFQSDVPIGDSQVVSVRAGGHADEVYVDFVVPSGDFNVLAQIRGTDPQDTNSANDEALSTMYHPIYDDDNDGIENDEDNCPNVANASQTDSDGDGSGDACDNDDDNDQLTDDQEEDLGTDPTDSDTDDDGTNDADDAYPTDPEQQTIVVPATEPETTTVVESETQESTSETTSEAEVSENQTTSQLDNLENSSSESPTRRSLHVSPNAAFTYEQTNWNTYLFRAQVPVDAGYEIEWDFGDGVTSTRYEVEHVYHGYTDYLVTLRVTDPTARVSHDAATVGVSFFNLHNRLIQTLIAILVIVLISSISVFVRSRSSRA